MSSTRPLVVIAAAAAVCASKALAGDIDSYKDVVRASLDLARTVKSRGGPNVESTMASCFEQVSKARATERDSSLPKEMRLGVVRPQWEVAAGHCKMRASEFCSYSYKQWAPEDQCKSLRAMDVR